MNQSVRSTLLVISTLILLGSGSGSALAQKAATWAGTCDVEFRGTSTLHKFTGQVPAMDFELKVGDAALGNDTPVGASINAAVADMDTKDAKRDKKMRESMKITSFPGVAVTVKDLKIGSTKPIWKDGIPQPTEIPFVITLLGKDQNLIGKVSDWKGGADKVSFTVSFTVSLKKSGIKVPAALGVLRVGDKIEIDADLELKRKSGK